MVKLEHVLAQSTKGEAKIEQKSNLGYALATLRLMSKGFLGDHAPRPP